MEHTPEVLSAKPPVCTTKISAESEHSEESDWSDMEWTKAGVKLTRLSESECLSDTDLGVHEDSSKSKKMKYQ